MDYATFQSLTLFKTGANGQAMIYKPGKYKCLVCGKVPDFCEVFYHHMAGWMVKGYRLFCSDECEGAFLGSMVSATRTKPPAPVEDNQTDDVAINPENKPKTGVYSISQGLWDSLCVVINGLSNFKLLPSMVLIENSAVIVLNEKTISIGRDGTISFAVDGKIDLISRDSFDLLLTHQFPGLYTGGFQSESELAGRSEPVEGSGPADGSGLAGRSEPADRSESVEEPKPASGSEA